MALTPDIKEFIHQLLDEQVDRKVKYLIGINDRERLNRLKVSLSDLFNSEDIAPYSILVGEEGKNYLENIITEYIMKIDDFLNK